MKRIFYILTILFWPSLLQAQGFTPGTQRVKPDPAALAAQLLATRSNGAGGAGERFHTDSLSPDLVTEGGNEADAITVEITDLAAQLQHDPLAIYNYCVNRIEYEHYWGAKKGATMTYLEGSGNAFDTAALMVALLRESGFSAGYHFGTVAVYDSDLAAWYKLDRYDADSGNYPFDDLSNSDFFTQYEPFIDANGYDTDYGDYDEGDDDDVSLIREIRFVVSRGIFSLARGLPFIFPYFDEDNRLYWEIPHVWVRVQIGEDVYELDPSFKLHEPAGEKIDLATTTGYDHSALSTAMGGTAPSNTTIQGLVEGNLTAALGNYTSNLTAWLKANRPNDSVDSILGREVVIPYYATSLGDEALIEDWDYFDSDFLTMQTWDAIPDEWFPRLTISIGQYKGGGSPTTLFTDTLSLAALGDQCLSLHFSGNTAYLSLNDGAWTGDNLTNGTITLGNRTTVDVQISVNQPFGSLDGSGDLDDTGSGDFSSPPPPIVTYKVNNDYVYALIHCYDSSPHLIRKRQEVMEGYLAASIAESDWRVRSELLNVMGLTYMEQTEFSDSLVGSQFGVLPFYPYRIGRLAQEAAYYLDMYQITSDDEAVKSNETDLIHAFQFAGLFDSALEHGILEQLQGPTVHAVSTMKVLQLANTANVTIYRGDEYNWSSINSTLSANYSGQISSIGNIVTGSHGAVLIPGSSTISSGNWTGWSYYLVGNSSAAALIAGNYSGGIPTSNGTVDSTYRRPIPPPLPPPAAPIVNSAEPVDLATGAYTYDRTDLELGGPAPRGLAFARNYNSSRHLDNSPGLGYGWTDNFNLLVSLCSNGENGLGQATSYQAAPYLAAIAAAEDLFTNHATAKDWLAAALTADWAIDQLTRKSVVLTMGDRTVEYTALPDGTFAAPAGLTATLAFSGNHYSLAERHGNTYNFLAINGTTGNGAISNITDLYGQALTFTYGNTGLLTTVTDSFSRNVTLNWTNGTLANITDSTGRHVDYSYTGGNLTSATDADGKTWTFSYDAHHNLTELKDPGNNTLVDNLYDGHSRVYEQDSQGNVSKAWKFYYTGFANAQEDPAGNVTTYYYDNNLRLLSIQDPLGNFDQRVYDGQDQIVQYYTPDGNLTAYTYDKNHNLTVTTNALGHNLTNTFDAASNLTATTDFRGNTTHFTYNSHFQPLTVVDATSTTILTNTYNATTGNLETTTDAGNNTTTFTMNGLGQVSRIDYADSTHETFTYNDLGDQLTHTDARGNVTSQTYDHHRRPLVTTLPGNATLTNVYDDEGNLQSVTDAGNHTTSYTYSPSQKLLTTTMPAVIAGTANTTNHYDTRDWLATTTDALGHNITYTFDAAQHLTATTDQLSHTVAQDYDVNGRVNSTIDAMNATTSFGYDAAGEQTRLTDALTHDLGYTYDENGNRLTLVNRRSQTYTYTYDADNRALTLETPLSHTTTTGWNARGLVQNITRPSGNVTAYTYDSRGRVATSNDTVGNLTFSYDNNGNLLTVGQGGANLTRAYDARNRVTSYTDGGNNTIGYGYDDMNNLTSVTYPGNHTVTYAYDARHELTSVTDWGNRTTSYTYDVAGKMTGITYPNGASRALTYDNAGRVTQIADWRAGSKRLALATFGYDANGRVTDEFAAPIPRAYGEANITATFDNDNRLLTFGVLSPTYDDDGNMLTGPLLASNVSANYTYNARNQLVSAGGVTNTYDALGNRIATTVGGQTTTYLMNPNAALPQVLIRTKPDTTQTYYVYGAGGVLLYEVTGIGGSESYKTYHYDARGNTAFILESDGVTVTDRMEYSPFGTTNYKNGTTDTPFLFGGAYGVMTDSSGLLFMRARFYNPLMHTFVNADPIGFGGGMNWYAYANGDPINAMDPLGLTAGDTSGATHYNGPTIGPVTGWRAYAPFWLQGAVDQLGSILAPMSNAMSYNMITGHRVSILSPDPGIMYDRPYLNDYQKGGRDVNAIITLGGLFALSPRAPVVAAESDALTGAEAARAALGKGPLANPGTPLTAEMRAALQENLAASQNNLNLARQGLNRAGNPFTSAQAQQAAINAAQNRINEINKIMESGLQAPRN